MTKKKTQEGISKSEKKNKARVSKKRVIQAGAGEVTVLNDLVVKKGEKVVVDTKGKGKLTINKITLHSGGSLSSIGDLELVPSKKTHN